MSPDTIVTTVLSAGLVLSGIAAIAALPWRQSEIDGAHRAAVALGRGILKAVLQPVEADVGAPVDHTPRVAVRALRAAG